MQGAAWTPDEEAQLLTEFHDDIPLFELARRHERTKHAIATRLVRLSQLIDLGRPRCYVRAINSEWLTYATYEETKE